MLSINGFPRAVFGRSRIFCLSLHRLRDNRGRGVALTVGQGMQFCIGSLRLETSVGSHFCLITYILLL